MTSPSCTYFLVNLGLLLPKNVYDSFQNGHHVIRRSDRYWTRLSTNVIIEQVIRISQGADKKQRCERGLWTGLAAGDARITCSSKSNVNHSLLPGIIQVHTRILFCRGVTSPQLVPINGANMCRKRGMKDTYL